MAYVLEPQTEEEKRLAEDQARAASGVPTGGAGTLPAGATPGPVSGASGNFTNLQRYLTENKSQAGDLANKVAGTVTAAGEEAKTAAEGVVNTGKAQIEAARVQPTGIVDEAATNAAQVAADEAKRQAFIRERDASYTGPAGLEDVEGYQTAQDKVRAAQDKIGLTGTEAGRTTLLQDMGGPGYGKGKATLNQLLLSGDETAAQTLQAAGEPYKGLQDYLGAQTDEARTAAQAAADEAAATRGAVQTRFLGDEGVIPSFGAKLDARVAAARTGAGEQFDAAANKIMAGQPLSTDELSLMGLTQADVDDLYKNVTALSGDYGQNVDLSQFVQRTGSPDLITRENFATDADYAEAIALAELMGTDPALLRADTRGQAGTAQTDLGDFSKEGISFARESLKSKDAQTLSSLTVDQSRRINNSVTGYDARNVVNVQRALNGQLSWDQVSQAFGLPKKSLISALKAAIRNGKFGGPGPFGDGPYYLTPQQESAILLM